MRRHIQLDDFETSSSFTVTSQGQGGKKAIGINTQQFKMKDISIETLIKNSNKEDFNIQTDFHTILLEQREQHNNGDEKDAKSNQANKDQDGYDETSQGQGSDQKMKKLSKFLRKVAPLMLQQLSEDHPLYQRLGTDEQSFFKKQSRLSATLENLDSGSQDKLQISDVSWNSTGVIVAASYSKADHEGTCSHKSMICLWALYKRNFKPTKPDIITTPNCINCISFHPKRPSIIACGSYTGQVLLYDYSHTQQQLIAKTTVDDYFHRDLITKILWWPFRPPGKPQTNYNILSLGTDGKILLWEILNQSIGEEANAQKAKMLLKYPIKGFLMLRKKQGEVIPVSGLTMNQSKINKNFFVVGSEGGSILRATLNPVNHYINTQSKVILDLQPTIKFRNNVYPFLLNILPKNLHEIKTHIQKFCTKNKIKQVDSLTTVFQSCPQVVKLYPNPISFAYQPLAFPISSISDNKYGLFIANAYEGYSRVYSQSHRAHLESIEQGWEWGWINGTHLMGGFVGQEWTVVDWATSTVVWSVGVGEGRLWAEQGRQVAVVCQRTKVKIIELGDKLVAQSEEKHKQVIRKIQQLKIQ